MKEVYVIYWSGTGNTEVMAQAVGDGISQAGGKANIVSVDAASPQTLKEEGCFALGCPSMGAEELEESEMEPFVAGLEGLVSGKTIGLFGSYGWGDGEWMREWVLRMQNAGAIIAGNEGVIANGEPDDSALEACRALGKALMETCHSV